VRRFAPALRGKHLRPSHRRLPATGCARGARPPVDRMRSLCGNAPRHATLCVPKNVMHPSSPVLRASIGGIRTASACPARRVGPDFTPWPTPATVSLTAYVGATPRVAQVRRTCITRAPRHPTPNAARVQCVPAACQSWRPAQVRVMQCATLKQRLPHSAPVHLGGLAPPAKAMLTSVPTALVQTGAPVSRIALPLVVFDASVQRASLVMTVRRAEHAASQGQAIPAPHRSTAW
jgi:hypothetical protein